MNTDVAAKDCWLVGQLAGIRMLENQWTQAFAMPSPGASEDLRQRVHELNMWLNLVDDALTVPALPEEQACVVAGFDVADPQFYERAARCLGRAPLRFHRWPNWPLPHAATALYANSASFCEH